jgi:hypothetical protein
MNIHKLILAALVACKPVAPENPADMARKLDFSAKPILPSPDSGTYYPSRETPVDPIVSRIVRGKHYDGALAGAAAGIALGVVRGTGGLTRWELREALWRAGWAHNAFDARLWNAPEGQLPPADVFEWVEQIPEDQPMALVRARGIDADAWVGILGKPLAKLAPIPRRASIGSELRLSQIPGARFVLADGAGNVIDGGLDAPTRLLLTTTGEWLLKVSHGTRELAHMPIYVEIQPPDTPVLKSKETSPLIADAKDADLWSRKLLTHIRTVYGLEAWTSDPLLDAAARQVRENPERAAAGSTNSERLVTWTCDDVTVENCMDAWLWDPGRRADLLSEQLDAYGLHTVLDARGVHLTLLLADTET